jgi:hypothetical protein
MFVSEAHGKFCGRAQPTPMSWRERAYRLCRAAFGAEFTVNREDETERDFFFDRFACRVGEECIVFGERPDGSMAHISETPSGLECNCVCPACRRQLVARKGTKNDHHFAHHGSNDERSCTTGRETALHRFAKEVLGHRRELVLPQLELEDELGRWKGPSARLLRFDSAILESKLGEIIPDLVVRTGERDLLVEFVVTHECDAAKIAKIKEMNFPAIEIDLSRLPRNASKWDIREAIIRKAPRKWLYNPKLERIRRERERTFAEHVVSLHKEYVATCARLRTKKARCPAFNKVIALGLARGIGIEVPGYGCFLVPPHDWQSTILSDAVNSLGGRPFITINRACLVITRRRWLHRQFCSLSRNEAAAIRALGASFDYPAQAVLGWRPSCRAWAFSLQPGREMDGSCGTRRYKKIGKLAKRPHAVDLSPSVFDVTEWPSVNEARA